MHFVLKAFMSKYRFSPCHIRLLLSLSAIIFLSACGGRELPPTQAPVTVIPFLDTPEPTPTPILPEDIEILFGQDQRGCIRPGEGYKGFVLESEGLCFIFAPYFEPLEDVPDGLVAEIVGLAYDKDGEVVRASLTIQTEAAAGRSLDEAVDAVYEAHPGERIFDAPITIDERPAFMLEEIPGENPARVGLVIANELLYTFTLSPIDETYPEPAAEASTLWSLSMASMHFFTPQPGAQETPAAVNTASWVQVDFPESGVSLLAPPDWLVESGPDGNTLRSEADPNQYLTFSTLTGLPTDSALDMLNAITQRMMIEGSEEQDTRPVEVNRIQGYALTGAGDTCQTIYIPAGELVHQIDLAPEACNPSGEALPVVQAILDSVRFSAP